MTSKWFYHTVLKCIEKGILDDVHDPIPSDIIKKYNLPELKSALRFIHNPRKASDAAAARQRFAFEEVFYIQIKKAQERAAVLPHARAYLPGTCRRKFTPRISPCSSMLCGRPGRMCNSTSKPADASAIFAAWLLPQPEALEGAEPRLQTLWLWRSAEESEHGNTAFDLYQALGGTHEWRIKVFKFITATFLYDVTRQTIRNMWHDGSLFHWRSWRSAGQMLFGRDGLIRGNYGLWKAYFAPDFHPSQQSASLSQHWLRDNAGQFVVVGQNS